MLEAVKKLLKGGTLMDEAWKLFEGTGKVTDYLKYCQNRMESGQKGIREQEETPNPAEKEERETGWDKMLY